MDYLVQDSFLFTYSVKDKNYTEKILLIKAIKKKSYPLEHNQLWWFKAHPMIFLKSFI